MINASKLDQEIRASGLPIVGVSANAAGGEAFSVFYAGCRIDLSRILTQAEKTALDALIAAHDPIDYAALRQKAARTAAKGIPNWAMWSQADLLNWFNANISATQINAETSLADAKIIQLKQSNAILAMAQLLIAFRDNIWPDLQDR